VTELDPITLEILWSRMIGVANEQAAALMRTSFTPVVRESGDLSAAVFDARGRMLAQAVTGTPGHINSLATSMRHFLGRFPPDQLAAGDVLLTNDPWQTSGQLNDLSVVTPAFRDGVLVGFLGNCCHAVDIGGRGLSADASEVYEEGLRIPITKLYTAGRPNVELLRLLAANVRAPDEVLGDLHAQVTANRVGAERLLAAMSEFGLGELETISDEVLGRSETAMRAGIRSLPDGRYEHAIQTDGLEEAITIRCALEISGDQISIDFAGSSPQSSRGMNVVLNYTQAYAQYALKCAIAPHVPHNEGSFRPVAVTAPEGSILAARFPAAVAARHIVGHFVPHAVLGALAQIVPERVIAEGSGNIWLTTVRGTGERRFVTVLFTSGGMGARPTADGLSCTSFPSAIATTAVETIESTSPLLVRRKELRRDSGGPGRHRGGLGQRIEVEVRTGEPYAVSVLADRMRFSAQGYSGGLPGARAAFRTSDGRIRNPKLTQNLDPGTRFVLELPGGGGFYDPRERAADELNEDIAEGLVSRSAARRDYGFAPSPGTTANAARARRAGPDVVAAQKRKEPA
jgi:N-methylhydantoinase B